MRAIIVAMSVSVLALSMIACGPGLKAPRAADGSKLQVYIVQDRNIAADAEPKKAEQRNQMSDYFEAHLKSLLTKYEYEVFQIPAVDQFVPGPNKFLLEVKVQSYNPGNKGARVAGALIGGWTGAAMGNAGEARLAAEFKLSGEQGKIAGSDLNEGSGTSDWQAACQKINNLILKSTSKTLQKLYKK
jgi:hypothetical protein